MTWETSESFWKQVAVPALSSFRSETLDLIKGVDVSLRAAEQRMQTLADRFESKADYLATKESEIGQLRASDEKQDKSIQDLWSKLNSLSDRVHSLESELHIVQRVQVELRSDIHGDTTINSPGLHGALNDMKRDILEKLTTIEAQAAITNMTQQQHERDIAALKRRRGVFQRIVVWFVGEAAA